MVYHHFKNGVSLDQQDDMIAVYLAPEGHGLGSGIITGGSLLRGATGGAGEIGHVIVQPTGARCRCGSRGCLEALLSAECITREINWGGRHDVHSLVAAADLVGTGDVTGKSAFARAGRNSGQGLAVLINLFNPSSIIVGGPAPFFADNIKSEAAKTFQKGFADAVEEYSFSDLKCHVIIDTLDPDVAASGAALIAEDSIQSLAQED